MGLTIATLTDCHLEDIESSKYQPVFASAENVLVKPIFFVDEKKTATPFHWNLPVCIKRNMARKPSSSVVCCRMDKQQLYSRISVWKIYSGANISSYLWPRRRFVKAISFLAEKNCFTLPLIVCLFLSEDSASGFNSTHFYWLLAHFPNAVTHN